MKNLNKQSREDLVVSLLSWWHNSTMLIQIQVKLITTMELRIHFNINAHNYYYYITLQEGVELYWQKCIQM